MFEWVAYTVQMSDYAQGKKVPSTRNIFDLQVLVRTSCTMHGGLAAATVKERNIKVDAAEFR